MHLGLSSPRWPKTESLTRQCFEPPNPKNSTLGCCRMLYVHRKFPVRVNTTSISITMLQDLTRVVVVLLLHVVVVVQISKCPTVGLFNNNV